MKSKTIKYIGISFIFSLLLITRATASTVVTSTDSSPQDSMYKYGALENQLSFADLVNSSADTNSADIGNSIETSVNTSLFSQPTDNFASELADTIKKQAFSVDTLEKAMDDVNRNNHGFKSFLLGTNLGILKFQLAQIKDQSALLKKMRLETEDPTELTQIDSHQEILKAEQVKVEDFLRQQENRFSLFGWLINVL